MMTEVIEAPVTQLCFPLTYGQVILAIYSTVTSNRAIHPLQSSAARLGWRHTNLLKKLKNGIYCSVLWAPPNASGSSLAVRDVIAWRRSWNWARLLVLPIDADSLVSSRPYRIPVVVGSCVASQIFICMKLQLDMSQYALHKHT